MSSGLFAIGSSALTATYTALQTTGNNIANANTPGYSRQLVAFAPQVSSGVAGTYIGSGVTVANVTRAYNALLTQQVDSAQAGASQTSTRASLLNQINNMFSSTSSGLGAAVDQFFSQVQTLTQQPSSLAVRQTMLSSAQQMSASFNDAYGQLAQMQQSANQQIAQEILKVNSTTTQIAKLNDQIAIATAAGGSPNDLLDQRDQAVQTLNQSIGVTTMKQTDGSVNVFLANGQPLVVGDQVSKMGMGTDPNNSQNIVVGTLDGTTVVPLSASNPGGGNIGALVQFSLQDIPNVENQIGRLATTLASQFNQQNKLGQDLNGNPGVNLFTPMSPTVIASNRNTGSAAITASFSDTSKLQASDYRLQAVPSGSGSGLAYQLTRLSDGQQTTLNTLPATVDGITFQVGGGTPKAGDMFTIEPVRTGATSLNVAIAQPQQIAAASPIQTSIPASNTGSLSVASLAVVGSTNNVNLTDFSVAGSLPNANLADSVTLNFSGPGSYTITDSTTGTTYPPTGSYSYTSGQPITFNGWNLTLLGTPAAGDQVNVVPNLGGTGDNGNALALAQLQNRNLIDGGQLGSGYAAVVAQVGTMSANAQSDQQNQATILQDAVNAQTSVSGVNLDEEAAMLLQYQQQYQAAAKVISIASTLFDQILSVAAAG